MLFSKLHTYTSSLTVALLIVLTIVACSSDKFIPDGQYLLDKVELHSDNKDVDQSLLMQYVHQKGNSRWFSLFKVPLGTYAMSGKDSTRWINRTLRKMGEKPVVYDTLQARLSCEDLTTAMRNMGYMNATVDIDKKVRGKKLTVIYNLHFGEPYIIDDFKYDIQDSVVAKVLANHLKSDTKRPRQFTVTSLDDERKRLTRILNDSGFYRFHKDFIYYSADSVKGKQHVSVTLHLMKYVENSDTTRTLHPRYIINNVNFIPSDSTGFHLRKSVLEDNTAIEKGKYFSATDLQNTYNNFSRLGAVHYTNINFREVPRYDSLVIGHSVTKSSTHYLDADIMVSNNKPNTISFQPEGTNTAGDLGAAVVLSYQNRNLFRGSEHLSLEFRSAFEAIKGLEGYKNSNYEEYSVQARLQFPRLLSPFTSKEFRRRSNATTEVAVSWNLQNRPEFHRRVFNGAWKYHWMNVLHHLTYDFDLLNLSYVYMPWISETFKHDYLDNATTRNAILRYNYQDLFIVRTGFGINYSSRSHAFRGRIELAGNILNGLGGLFKFKENSLGKRTLFNIAYAQYAKFDFDYTQILRFDERNTLVLHGGLGIAYPYGNSTILPFEKRYFSGGANSVRGWSVRELGPGKFRGVDGRIDFINQTGDMKLDLNAEYRTHLFWKFDGAAFIDAGNIWTLRDYANQPGGQFHFKDFYKQIAVAYGLGLRLNFDYFVLRLDGGMKAINPAYTTTAEHYALWHPNLKRDFTFHFAVGLPF
ncbi:BamA/TamA family outer membrane protein [Prevotella veroralis]|nr:BamA/TamA family outer membrane protein [Prevotella veroralis]QUB41326.1 BamA/TamA family outer membrane protein [Prevotella veroralis]